MNLFDASAVIALVAEENGADIAAGALDAEDGAVSVVNLAEFLEVAERAGGGAAERLEELRELFQIVPMTEEDALMAARLYPITRRTALSLADRIALATALRLGIPVLTTERAWVEVPGVDVRVIR